MMIKANGEYLDFNDVVEIERQVKLFEDINTSDGDYSYDFELPWTEKNVKALTPSPDNSLKPVYSKITAELLTDEAQQIYDGYIRVEQVIREQKIVCSFFAGNNNWFGLLSGPLSDIDFSSYDQAQTLSNIILGHSATSGIVYPVVDNGGLITRGYRHMKVEDFVAGIYVKTVFKKIFQAHSIKIKGDLLKDPTYNSLITLKNGKSQEDITAVSAYAGMTTTVARLGETVRYKMIFQTDSTFPYFDGSANAFDLPNSRYVAPFKMRIDLEASFKPQIVDASYNERIYVYINGAYPGFVDIGLDAGGLYNSATPGSEELFTMKRILILEAGDTLEIYTEWQQSTGSTQNDVLSGFVKITPTYVYQVFGNAVVPKWTQAQYVSNILRIFNVLPSYEPKTKTLTLNYFNKIKETEAIDLSRYISSTVVDYKEFISSYGKRNLFSYNEVDFEDLRTYNVQNFFKYGQGVIESTNQFLEDSKDVIESDFSNPIDYINPIFDMSMSRTNLLTLDESDSFDITGVTDSGGNARFAVDENNIADGDLVRISESKNPVYNGDWVVDTKGVGFLELYGVFFDTNAIGKIQRLDIKYNDVDDVYLLFAVPFYTVTKFSGFSNIRIEFSNRTFVGLAYFSLLNMGRQINTDYKQSLSFGDIESEQFYQRTILETYWTEFARIVNDPVKLISIANLPLNVFSSIDFLRCISVTTLDTTNRYYMNRITGYISQERDAVLEMIKLP